MRRTRLQRNKARIAVAPLSETGQNAVGEWNDALAQATSLSAIAPIVERVKAYAQSDRGEALRQVARELKEDALPLLRALCASSDRALQLEAMRAASQVHSDEAAEIVTPLAENSDAQVRKAARRALEHLRSLGVRATVPMGGGIIGASEPVERFQDALLGGINGLGQRMVSLAQRIPGHGIAVAQVAMDDARGVYDVGVGLVRRAEYDTMREAIGSDPTQPVAPAPWAYGVHLLRAARKLNEATNTPPPEGFRDLDTMLAEEKSPPAERPLIYEHLAAEDLQDNKILLAESEKLFTQPMFACWMLPRSQARPIAEKLKEFGESWLFVPEAAQQDRANNIVREAMNGIFDAEGRARYRHRLEEMAYLLLNAGESHLARVALATALALGKAEASLPAIPFVGELIGRSLRLYAEIPAEHDSGEDPSPSPIVLPFGTPA